MKSDIGIIGLSVMGSNLARNMAGKGFRVTGFDYWPETLEAFRPQATREGILLTSSLAEMVQTLGKPRKILMMVKAGKPVDDLMDPLLTLLDPGDVIIDGGNSHFPDTGRRIKRAEGAGILYVGTGISGGEEGALKGPSIMPGGSPDAWPLVEGLFREIAAKAEDGSPCCEWIGPEGSGHFVKMVHNGIEYGDMQLICETYQILRDLFHLDNDAAANLFAGWNQKDLNSYLIGITSEILRFRDDEGNWLVDKILDKAGQKGTGQWTVKSALDLGIPLTLISESVFARSLSALKSERVVAERQFGPKTKQPDFPIHSRKEWTDELEQALFAAKILSYAQGYMLLRAAAIEYGWKLNYSGIAGVWRGGCIIRSGFLDKIRNAFVINPDLENLLLDPYFGSVLRESSEALRNTVSRAILAGIPVPAFSAAVSFLDGYTSAHLPANLLQAQRDYFGAHTYERTDRNPGEFFHTQWTQQED